MMICVSTVTYSFKVNGELVGFVSPKRGIRQGDPLSPYLFVLYAEGLSVILRNAEERRLIKGVAICKNAPSISHLLFAYDSFLFARGTLDECENIKLVLTKYELASRQAVNFIKSCVAFSPNLTECDQQLLAVCLGVRRVQAHDRYLGLQVFGGKSKKETFTYVKERLWKKLQGWRGGFLSSAGKELLVKTVAQELPMYTMQCFLLPKSFCEELNMMIAKFWWSGEPGKHKIHWVNWRTLCKSKEEGGWVSEISMLLALLFLRNRCGDLSFSLIR